MDWMRLVRPWWGRQPEKERNGAAKAPTLTHRTPPPPYYQDLLTISARFLTEGKDRAAVLVGQMASEVIVEDTLNRLIERKNLGFLRDAILETVGGSFNIASRSGVRVLYEALSGDHELVSQPFWSRYCEHVRRRDDVTRSGRQPSAEEGMESYQAVADLVRYLERSLETAE
jgi:hypothetical protein